MFLTKFKTILGSRLGKVWPSVYKACGAADTCQNFLQRLIFINYLFLKSGDNAERGSHDINVRLFPFPNFPLRQLCTEAYRNQKKRGKKKEMLGELSCFADELLQICIFIYFFFFIFKFPLSLKVEEIWRASGNANTSAQVDGARPVLRMSALIAMSWRLTPQCNTQLHPPPPSFHW